MTIYRAAHSTPPHLFKIGHVRNIEGERCLLLRYTRGRNPRPQYRRPDGSTFTIHPKQRQRKAK